MITQFSILEISGYHPKKNQAKDYDFYCMNFPITDLKEGESITISDFSKFLTKGNKCYKTNTVCGEVEDIANPCTIVGIVHTYNEKYGIIKRVYLKED